MHLANLELRSFRNYAHFEAEFSPEVQVFVGDNAQGKTNVLEAIHYLSSLRSFRGPATKELIRFGDDAARVRGVVASPAGTDELVVTMSGDGRKATVNAKELPVHDYLAILPSVRFTPDDILLLKGEGGPRRRALDRAVFGLLPAHLRAILDYNRALKQKNALLKSTKTRGEHLEVWNQRLSELGAKVVAARLSFVDRVNPLLREFFAEISASDSGARVIYRGIAAPPRNVEALQLALLEQLNARIDDEIVRGHTLVGPHRDDLGMEIGGKSVRRYASQGQHRMFALALKIAEIELHHRELGRYPVLLLDDVKSELDADRVRYLFGFLNRIPAQIFVTSTDFRELSGELTRPRTTWKVVAGVATRQA